MEQSVEAALLNDKGHVTMRGLQDQRLHPRVANGLP